MQLAVTAGQDAIARVWDLRSGKNVLVLQGHLKSIQGLDIAPNGSACPAHKHPSHRRRRYHILTGSSDNSVRDACVRPAP